MRVPLGTSVYDEETQEYLGDVQESGQMLLVAGGGRHGLGNVRFKSSTNRAPRADDARRIRTETKSSFRVKAYCRCWAPRIT